MAKAIRKKNAVIVAKSPAALFNSITKLIEQSKVRVTAAVNAELTQMYWNIGHVIRQNILQNTRAGYGEQIVETLSERLTEA